MSDLAEEKHDRNEDLSLQFDEFAAFMWETAPKVVKEAKTVKNLKHETLDWLEDIEDRASSAGFSLVSPNANPSLSPELSLAPAEKKSSMYFGGVRQFREDNVKVTTYVFIAHQCLRVYNVDY